MIPPARMPAMRADALASLDEAEEPPNPRYARLWKAELWESYRQIYATPAVAGSDIAPGYETSASHRATVKKSVSLVVRVALTVAAFVLLSRSLSWATLTQTLAQVRLPILVAGLLIGCVGIILSAFQWQSLLRGERIYVGIVRLTGLYLVGIAFSHFLPTGMGGDAVKAIYVARDSGNKEGSVSAVLMSRVTGLFGMLLIAFTALVIWHTAFAPNIVLSFLALSAIVGGGLIGALLFALLIPRLLKGRWKPRGIFAWPLRIANALVRTSRRPRTMAEAILFGLAFWITGCLNYWAYGTALGIQVPLYVYFVAIPLVSLLTFLP
ncbi:MAG: flippase-like domain-containing protein, partial [Ktedonobacterales bacterium]|nr:flippase-like domain-containing protein [Ktedonobacterales bacterium]